VSEIAAFAVLPWWQVLIWTLVLVYFFGARPARDWIDTYRHGRYPPHVGEGAEARSSGPPTPALDDVAGSPVARSRASPKNAETPPEPPSLPGLGRNRINLAPTGLARRCSTPNRSRREPADERDGQVHGRIGLLLRLAQGGFFVAVAPLVLPQRADHVDDDLDVGPEFELPLLGLRAHVRRMVPRVVS
jgi:hypothetical protein